jgi:protein O-GlcNAc transferase
MTDNSPTLDQLLQSALAHHQAGRLSQAEAICRQVLQQDAGNADALHLLGVIAYQVGRHEIAVDLIRQAIAFQPGNVEAHGNLCSILREKGRLDEAVVAYRQLIALKTDSADLYIIFGNVLIDKGLVDEAISAYRKAIALKPDYAEAYSNLGNALKNARQVDEAIAVYRQAIALKPDYAEAHNNLGNALKHNAQLNEAVAAYRQAIALKPDYAGAYNNLGDALRHMGRPDEAVAACRQAIALSPNYVEAYNSLGIALKENGQLEEAVATCRQATVIEPDFPDAYVSLGNALIDNGQLDDAVAAYGQAIRLRPDYAAAHNNLGNALKDKGQLDEAIAAYGQAIALEPDNPQVHSSLIFTIYFHPEYNARAIAEEHRRWGQRHAEPLKRFVRRHDNDRDPERRLRVGYVSPDFKEHCQALFMTPLLAAHNSRHVKIICYSDVVRGDARTSQLQRYAAQWRNIVGRSDQDVADLIREDRIDVLVDLTMHMARNRLLVFARKPAPVLVCWLAFPGSTGVETIDYRLSDPYIDPPGIDESVYSERTMRLPDTFWCYEPLDGREIPVNPLPALDTGTITFGCLNNFCKINDGILDLWAQVLRQVENSRLLLLAPAGSHRQWTVDRLSKEGIDPRRIEFVARMPRREYLKQYHLIDVGLDSFPSNGHTTSLDSLWMGVPVVTLVGQHPVSRAGWCQLSNLGLTELAAHHARDFVRIATDLANDLPRLAQLRSTLRQRMQNSPLMDARRFARNIETAYRLMWRNWCEQITR